MEKNKPDPEAQLQIFTTESGVEIQIRFEDETVWATQKQIAELFETTLQNITMHLKNAYESQEIEEEATCKQSLQVQKEGKRTVKRNQLVYNLDAILSVGYRISTKRGTQFRIWAARRLKDYLVQGYAINESRLNQKQQKVKYLKTGIRIFGKAVADKAGQEDLNWLRHFAKGLKLLDDYDHEQLCCSYLPGGGLG